MGRKRLDHLIDKLRKSVLFAPDFPRRRRHTHAEFATLGDQERLQIHEAARIAIDRAPDFRDLVSAVCELSEAQHAAAVPLLAELWADCALQPVRNAAGHALGAIGTPEARQALWVMIEDSEHLSVFLAVAAVFDENPATAFDRFSPYFEPARVAQPGGDVVPNSVLAVFSPDSFGLDRKGKVAPKWLARPKAPKWLQHDPRWVALCVTLRADKRLGRAARDVLRYADAGLVGPVLKEAQTREGPRAVRPATKAPGDLLQRYLRGEHGPVWDVLRSHQALGGHLLEEARTVATETMRRVAHNVDVLAERLATFGWTPLDGALRMPPHHEDQETLQRLAAVTGAPLPLSLRAFWETVGGVNFVWDYYQGDAPDLGPDLPMAEMDPLCVDPPEVANHHLERWEEQRSGIDPEIAGPFTLDLAPDNLHKANISGGAPYGIELPFLGADPVFANEAHELPFVDYLRLCFRWGGFPGLERHAERPDVRKFLEVMGEGLEEF